MRVIYSTTPLVEWADVAEKLSNQYDITPCYWICRGELKNQVKNRFPETTVHDTIDSIQGRFPDTYGEDAVFEYPIDEELLEDFLWNESQALKMMDRLDAGNVTGADMTYSERIRHYHRLLMYWKKEIENLAPDLVIFGSSPHVVSDYILYNVCKYSDIKTLLFTPTSIPKIFYVRQNIRQTPGDLRESSNRGHLPGEINEYLTNLKGDYRDAEPDYMKNHKNSNNVSDYVKKLINIAKKIEYSNKIARHFTTPHSTAYIKLSSKLIENSRTPRWRWILYRQKSKLYKKRLKRHYDRVAINPDFSSEYIYFPLHYQPERTTSPEGGMYVHQYLAVNLLSSISGDGTKIFVKEHPTQFDSELKGELGRKPYFYDDICDIPHVELVPLETSTFELIDNSLAVATITGTAGWESVVRGTPAITFGNAWYRDSPGCYPVKTGSDISQAIADIRERDEISSSSVVEYVKTLIDVGYRGYVITRRSDMNKNQNVDSICRAVRDNLNIS